MPLIRFSRNYSRQYEAASSQKHARDVGREAWEFLARPIEPNAGNYRETGDCPRDVLDAVIDTDLFAQDVGEEDGGGTWTPPNLRADGERADNGTTTYPLTADTVEDVSVDRFGHVTRVAPGRLRVVITESGFVRRVALTVPVRVGDDDGMYAVTIRYDRTAEPPERPDWVPPAIDRTAGDDRPSDDEPTSDDG